MLFSLHKRGIEALELRGKDFQEVVIRVVESSKLVLGIIHWRIRHPVMDRIKGRSDVRIYEVTPQNREMVQTKIMKEMSNALRKKSG